MNVSEWNYARDGSMASRHRPAGAGVKPPGAAAFRKGVVVSDHGKGVLKASGMDRRDERKRTSDDASKNNINVVKTGEPNSSGISPEVTCLLTGRQPVYRRHDFDPGSCMERGNLFSDVKRNPQAVATVRENTDAGNRGGAVRSSDEAPVMGVERRDCIIQPDAWTNLLARRSS